MRTVHMHAPRRSPAFLVLAASVVALSTAAHAQVRPVVPGPVKPDARPSAIDPNAAEIPFDDQVPVDVPEWVIEPMGAWGGPVHAFEKHGDIGYVSSGQRLVILDMSDLTDIKELGTVKLGSTVQDFKVRDGLAYVATIRVLGGTREEMGIRHSGFHVVDVSDIHAPEIIWSDATNERFVEVDLWGDLCILRNFSGNMWAADLTDPRAPVMRGGSGGIQFRNSSGTAMKLNDLKIQGNLAYMAVQETLHQFQIFDLSTITPGVWPAVPQRLGTANFFIQREARKVAVEGDWAYVLGRDTFVLAGVQDEAPGEIIWAVNVSNPAAPVKHGTFADFSDWNAGGQAKPVFDLAVFDGRLYAADGVNTPNPIAWDLALGVAVFDVATNPAQPALLGAYKGNGSVRGVLADESAVYLFERGEGLMVMDAGNPAALTKIGGYHSPAEIGSMALSGDRLFIADRWYGLTIVDVADLSRPVLLGSYQTPQRFGLGTSGVAVDENGMAYLAAGRAGMEIINASNPANPFLRSAIRFPSETWTTSGPIAFDTLPGHPSRAVYLSVMVGGTNYLFSIDVSNPLLPMQADPSPPQMVTAERLSRYAPGRFLMAPGGFYLYDINGSNPMNVSVSLLSTAPQPKFVSVACNEATGIAASTYYSQSAGTWFVTYDMNSVDYGAELASVPMRTHGDVTFHPRGALVLGEWAHNTPNRVSLVGLQDPSKPQVLAGAPLAFSTSSYLLGLRASVLAAEHSVLVANHSGNTASLDLVGVETFQFRRAADRNADGAIDALDLWIFLDEVHRGVSSADLNGDGIINTIDIEAFLRILTGPEGR